MLVQVKSSHGPSTMPIETILLAEREIYIQESVTTDLAMEFSKAVRYLALQDKDAPIRLYLNTPGGEVMAGLLMYDVIAGSGLSFETVCTGCCYSFGAILLSAGNHGRYILPNSRVMIHEPQLMGSLQGSTTSIRTISDSLLETKRRLNEILCRHSSMSMEQVEAETSYDHFLSPEEAVKLGLCDKIIEYRELLTAKEVG